MVVGETKRQDGSNGDLAVERYGFCLTLTDAQDRHLWCVDDRRKMVATDAALIRDRERAALKLLDGDFSLPGLLRERMKLRGELKKILLVDIAQNRHDQTAFCVDGDADVAVIFGID